jgi:Fur family ferric uptake transcriptional regulator
MTPTSDELALELRARGLRATPQRILIDRVVRSLGRHATAEEIHQAVAELAPNVSLPTTYATLELLEALGRLRRLAVPGGSTVYDPRGEHEHAVCRSCGAVVDLEVDVATDPVLRAAQASGFRAERVDVVASGLCADCAGG